MPILIIMVLIVLAKWAFKTSFKTVNSSPISTPIKPTFAEDLPSVAAPFSPFSQ